jgi:hypothetical protein
MDGRAEGWSGLCSPNICRINGLFYLTYNSWGDIHPNGQKNALFYMTSPDCEHWTAPKPVGLNLTHGKRAIDIAIEYANHRFYVMWKEDFFWHGRKVRKARIAVGNSLDADLDYIRNPDDKENEPASGVVQFYLEGGGTTKRTQENYQLIRIDGTWYCLSLDYAPHEPFLYRMRGNGENDMDWTVWDHGYPLAIPEQKFNTAQTANAPFLMDWREYDNYFYILYAGRTEGYSHAGRGNNKLGLARSLDLKSWEPAD